jgi:hypothetical protein
MDYVSEVSGDVFSYDSRIFSSDWDPVEEVYDDFLNNCA